LKKLSWYAHSLPDERDKSRWQPLADHLQGVASRSADRGAKFGAGPALALGGLLHDLGKYTREFQARSEGGPPVDHATAGAREIIALASSADDRFVADIIAHAIAGHHAALPDSFGADSSLETRRNRKRDSLDSIWRDEIVPVAEALLPAFLLKPALAFRTAFFGRMAFSCLVDADFLDTEAFYAQATGTTVDREWPRLLENVGAYVARCDRYMNDTRTGNAETRVNTPRGEILRHVRARAHADRGLFTLTADRQWEDAGVARLRARARRMTPS
jgi:CRISPR-associated endonuclease/helicase Cas3